MLFNSLHFLLFLPITVVVYYLLPYRYRWGLLLVASYYFYMCWRVEYILLIVFSTLIDYYAARLIHRSTDPTRRKFYLACSLGTNLGLLFFFKYFNFLGTSVNEVFQYFSIGAAIPYYHILLPVGISFYTFQTLSYTIDVYRGDKEPETHLGKFAVYVSYFPQLVAGPIERSVKLIPQLHKKHDFTYDNISKGVKLIIWGFFLKLVVADRAAIYVNTIYNHVEYHGGLSFLLATFLFSFQIYGDFAGYSAIAIGSSRLMGIELMQNFNRPYLARSIQNFWQRWHISLSTWFRDYVYIPLGGNRVSTPRWLTNLFVTFVISGVWHGANWTFVIWGALHGVYLILEVLFGQRHRQGLLNIVLTFLLVNIAWVFFRANSVGDAFYILHHIVTTPGQLFTGVGVDITSPVYAMLAITLLMAIEVKQEFFPSTFSVLNHRHEVVRIVGYASLIFITVYLGVFGESQFIYFQF